MDEKAIYATLAVGVMNALINSGAVRLTTSSGTDDRNNEHILDQVVRLTNALHKRLFS